MLGRLIRSVTGGAPALEVAPTWLTPVMGGDPLLAISVTNNDSAPVEVEEVGFLLPDGQKFCFISGLKGGGALPHRLAPGESITVPLNAQAQGAPPLQTARCTYAAVAGGQKVTGATLRVGELTR